MMLYALLLSIYNLYFTDDKLFYECDSEDIEPPKNKKNPTIFIATISQTNYFQLMEKINDFLR